ncbi:MAG: hypothetical protein AB9872_13415 [Solidesulfovibrio sp.]
MKTVTQTNSPGWIKKKFHDFGMGEMFAPLAVDRLEEDDALLSKALIDLHVLHHYPFIRTAKNVMSVVAAADQFTLGDNIVFAVGGVVFSTHDQDRSFVIPDNMTVFLRAEVDSTCGDLVASASTQNGTLTPLARKQVCAFTLAEGAETDSEGVGGGASSPTSMRILKAVKGAAGSIPTITLYANDGHCVSGSSSQPVTPPTPTFVVTPAQYDRDVAFAAKPVSVAADRYILLSPSQLLVNVGGFGLYISAQQALDLSLAATWDSTATDYTIADSRAGKDFYIYACYNAGVLKFLASANSTYPEGFTSTTSRKIGGFHCLCKSVGTIAGHALSDYLTGDILPASVWDLKHRPAATPEGMAYDPGLRMWVDIYGNSFSQGQLQSVFGATLADGASSPAFHWLKAAQYLSAIGKRMFWQHEFVYLAHGSNEGTAVSSDPNVAGAFVDSASRRMISNTGLEMMNGGLSWFAIDTASVGAGSWRNGFDANDSGVKGSMIFEPNRACVGGSWDYTTYCGSRSFRCANGPLALIGTFGVRGVSTPSAAY